MSFDRTALARIPPAIADGIEAAADFLEQESNAMVPDLTGTLQASSKATVDRLRGEAAVSYDDPAAVPQHERLDYAHDDGQAKFLETALFGNDAEILRLLASEVRRGFQ